MCLGQRILATGERVQEQCPKVAITPDSWMHTFGRIGQQHPEMTLSEFAERAKMSLIDVLRNIYIYSGKMKILIGFLSQEIFTVQDQAKHLRSNGPMFSAFIGQQKNSVAILTFKGCTNENLCCRCRSQLV